LKATDALLAGLDKFTEELGIKSNEQVSIDVDPVSFY
jgi:hypothetical protein